MSEPEHRGYETPVMADVETAYRRFIRFQLKVIAVFLVVAAVVGGVVLYHVHQDDLAHRRPVSVPDLSGLDNVTAAFTLERAGLTPVYTRFDRASPSVPLGHVISTDPPAGSKWKRDVPIRVTMSCGPPQPPLCNP